MNPIKQTIRNTISLNIPDNHVRQVTPALLREVLEQMLDFSEQVINGGVQDLTTTEDGAEWDVELGNKAFMLLSNDVTLSIVNPSEGGMYWLIVLQDEEGSKSVALPDNSVYEGGTDTLVNQEAGSVSIFTALFDGTNFLWLNKSSDNGVAAAALWQQTEW